MNAQPKFTDCYGKPLAPRRKHRKPLKDWQKLVLGLLIVGVMPFVVMGAVTQIDLAHAVKGTLAVSNGGTGLATLTAHNLMLGEGTSNVGFLSCGAGTTLLGNAADPTCSATPTLGVASTTTGSVTMESSGNAFANIWSSGSGTTATNTVAGFTAVPTTGHVVTCTVSSTTCTLTDGGAALTGTFADDETPSGTVNSSNQTFTLAHTPSPAGSLLFYLNGQLLKPGGADYTLTTNSIATVGTPQTGDVLLAWYRY